MVLELVIHIHVILLCELIIIAARSLADVLPLFILLGIITFET